MRRVRDGGGFKPNGDTLGWNLPVKGLSVAQVKHMLEEMRGPPERGQSKAKQ